MTRQIRLNLGVSRARCCICGLLADHLTPSNEQDGGPLGIWRKWADHVEGEAVTGGHFFPEENPAETTEILTRFLSA